MYTLMIHHSEEKASCLNLAKQMASLMIPLVLSNILQQFYNTADAFVLGHFSDANDFAAVGIASSIFNLFLFAIVGASTGISILFSRYAGADDQKSFRNEHFLTFVFGLAASGLLATAGILFLPFILRLTQVPDTLHHQAYLYLFIMLAGLPASWLYNMYSAILRSIKKAAAILIILMVAVAGNIVLDILFVACFKMGITGAAIATATAQYISAALGFAYLKWTMPDLIFRKEDCYLDKKKLTQSLRLASVTAIHQTSLYFGKLCIQGIVNTGGISMISAYTATTRIEGFANSFGDSGAAATSVIAARNVGAGKKEQVRNTFSVSLLILTLLGAVCSTLMFLSARPFSALLLTTSSEGALSEAVHYLRAVSIFYIFCFAGNTFAGYFDGIGKVQVPFLGAASHISIRILFSFLLIRYLHMDLTAVALATGIGWIWANLFWAICRRVISDKTPASGKPQARNTCRKRPKSIFAGHKPL